MLLKFIVLGVKETVLLCLLVANAAEFFIAVRESSNLGGFNHSAALDVR